MKNKVLFICLLFLFICLTGCSKEETTDTETAPDTEVTVAAFDGSGISLEGMLTPMLMGDNLYFWKGSWDNDSKRWSDSVIYRKAGGKTDVKEIVPLEDRELLCFTVDANQNLYYLYAEYSDNGKDLFFQKDAPNGSMIYNVPVSAEAGEQILYDIEQGDRISQGIADPLGRVIFRNPSGSLYLFDEKGEFLCIGRDGWDAESFHGTEKGLVNAGENGIYTYAVLEDKVMLSSVDMADANTGEITKLAIETDVSINVFSGYEKGILISDNVGLWKCDPAEAERELLLDWDSAGLKNYDIDSIGILEDGRLYMMVTREGRQDKELAYIETMLTADVPEIQTIVIGSLDSEAMQESGISKIAAMAEEFNHYNRIYQVEIKYYDTSQDLYLELLKGEGPDGFQLFQESALASKGVLEDLSPYFAGSGMVQESDLLPSVRNAGSRDGKLLYVFTEFQIRGHIVKQGTIADGVWTPEEYLELGIQNPEALLCSNIGSYMVMENALYADMGSFVDWKERKCSFDNERFINIMEGVRQVTEGKQTPDIMEALNNRDQWLHDGRIMTDFFNISDVWSYLLYKDQYGDFAEFPGYPNSENITYYRFMPGYMLAMNSASENKEGVWAFMEFLLSEEYQGSLEKSFPVRQDSFEKQIAEQMEVYEKMKENPLEISAEDITILTNMVDNAYCDNTFDDIWRIISEEMGSFWSGDKTAEAVADIIQNRVQLYLDE